MALRPAKWKSVPFHIDDATGEFGRRNVLHEYPGRNKPYGEDMGRAPRRVSLTAFFLGDENASAMDRALSLLIVMEQEGPGELIHPWLGQLPSMQLANPGKVQFPKVDGGRISIQLDLVEAGTNHEPSAEDDPNDQLQSAADAIRKKSKEQLEKSWLDEVLDALDAAAKRVEGACAALEKMMSAADKAEAQLDRAMNAVQRIISAPLKVVSRFEKRVDRITGKVATPFSGVSAWKRLMGMKSLSSTAPSGSRVLGGQPQWKNTAAASNPNEIPPLPTCLAHWLRRELVIRAVETLLDASFASKADIAATQKAMVATLNAELLVAPDALYAELHDLKVAAIRYLRSRTPHAADLKPLDVHDGAPVLVAAYRKTGSIAAADDLIARNSLRHPGFIPAGKVEVLDV